jgi:hypothetical protein
MVLKGPRVLKVLVRKVRKVRKVLVRKVLVRKVRNVRLWHLGTLRTSTLSTCQHG